MHRRLTSSRFHPQHPSQSQVLHLPRQSSRPDGPLRSRRRTLTSVSSTSAPSFTISLSWPFHLPRRPPPYDETDRFSGNALSPYQQSRCPSGRHSAYISDLSSPRSSSSNMSGALTSCLACLPTWAGQTSKWVPSSYSCACTAISLPLLCKISGSTKRQRDPGSHTPCHASSLRGWP